MCMYINVYFWFCRKFVKKLKVNEIFLSFFKCYARLRKWMRLFYKLATVQEERGKIPLRSKFYVFQKSQLRKYSDESLYT